MAYLCRNPWTSLYVWGDGTVTHCCYSNIGSLGNIKTSTISEIWNSPKLQRVRNRMRRGDFIAAGCEYYCRPFRWNEFYGHDPRVPPIPAGLGRLETDPGELPPHPPILGLGMDWICNLHCRHCLSSREARGVPRHVFETLLPAIETSTIVRFMGGEFSVNPRCLDMIETISRLRQQPTLFISTNGQVSLRRLEPALGNLRQFHVKFSLEGLGADYEAVRAGGTWARFETHLAEADAWAAANRQQGRDWRVFLNFCVMRANLPKLAAVVRYARDRNLPLVLNTINGMRHVEENIFMYPLGASGAVAAQVREECLALLEASPQYDFRESLCQHLDYIFRTMHHAKLNLARPLLRRVQRLFPGHRGDVLLYGLYRLKRSPRAFFLYGVRKLLQRIARLRFRVTRGCQPSV